jgi:hypothetical protein
MRVGVVLQSELNIKVHLLLIYIFLDLLNTWKMEHTKIIYA